MAAIYVPRRVGDLTGVTPVDSLPSIIYALSGRQLNLYPANFLRSTLFNDLEVRFKWGTGVTDLMESETLKLAECFRYTPTDSDVPSGTHNDVPLTITARLDGATVWTKTVTIRTVKSTAGTGTTRKLVTILDSLYGFLPELNNLFAYNKTSPADGGGADAMTVTHQGYNSMSGDDADGNSRTVACDYMPGWGFRAASASVLSNQGVAIAGNTYSKFSNSKLSGVRGSLLTDALKMYWEWNSDTAALYPDSAHTWSGAMAFLADLPTMPPAQNVTISKRVGHVLYWNVDGADDDSIGNDPGNYLTIVNPFFDYPYVASAPDFTQAGRFDFGRYLTNQAISLSAGDWVLINLGINDFSGIETDADLATMLDNIVDTDLTTIIGTTPSPSDTTMIRGAVSGVRVGILTIIPPSASQDAFGINAGSPMALDRRRYLRNVQMYNERLMSSYDNATFQGRNIHIIPVHLGMDTVNNMSLAGAAAANIRTANTLNRQNNAVHPAADGCYQMADQIKSFLKGIES